LQLRWHSPSGLSVVICLLVLSAHPAQAAVTDYLGRQIIEVHVQAGDTELRDPAVFEILDTKVGEPLTMAHVRETLVHLFGLGRYVDIQVDAALKDTGVVLTYQLVPVQRVRRIAFEGSVELSKNELRRAVVDRYGASPPVARAPQVVASLRTLYRDHGYPHAEITAAAQPDAASDEGGTLVFSIAAGAQARIGTIDVQGTPLDPAPALLNKLSLRTGDPYDGLAIDARLARFADDLRAKGYYEARVAQLPRYADGDRTVNLLLSVETGPHVEIVFRGDPLTPRERADLVPIAREHSVDEDILEDAKFGIEGHFRAAGYCNPRADYQRTTTGDVLTIAFSVTHGPQCVLEDVQIAGNSSISSEELLPLIRSVTGQPLNENTIGADVSRIQGLYRRRGFAAVKVALEEARGDVRAGAVPVRVRIVVTEGVRSVIQSVVFDGSGAIDVDTLRQTVMTTVGQAYFEPQISSDADALAQLYLNRGYLEVSVQPNPRPTADRSGIDLHFNIHEGPQVFVDHVLIVGNTRTKTDTIAAEVQLKGGQPLSVRDEDETRTRITALGIFRRVDISYLELPGVQTHRDVLITVEEAPVTSITYGGGVEGGRNLARKEDQTGTFDKFYVAPRGSFSVSRNNLLGKNSSITLDTRVSLLPRDATPAENSTQLVEHGGYGFNEYLARLSYGERRIFGTPADGTFTGGVEQTRRSSFYFNRRSASVALARQVKRVYTLSGRYTIDRTRVFDIKIAPADRPLIDRLFPQVRLSTFSSSVIRDTRDDPVDPTMGGLIGVDGELAARRVGSEVGFFKTFLQGFTYRRVGSGRTIAAFGARVGLATGFPRTIPTVVDGQTVSQTVSDLPASERFFAGGDTTVRGFTLDSLGRPDTIDADGFPKGGHGLMVFNTELRTPVRGSLGAVVFVDVGNVFLHVNDMNPADLRAAAGFGLRYRSPIGPIRVDLGFKLNRVILPNGSKERPTALHISLGQAF
jgi:outer membrane protein insertion porin family